MRVLGLDQATINTGYAIIDNGALMTCDVIVAKQKDDLIKRIAYIIDEVFKIIEEYNIDYVVFEDIQLENGNVATFKKLAELYGILDYELTDKQIPHHSMLAAEWRADLGIKNTNRSQAKKNDIEYVKIKTGLSVLSDDVADAICIGLSYFAPQNDWTK